MKELKYIYNSTAYLHDIFITICAAATAAEWRFFMINRYIFRGQFIQNQKEEIVEYFNRNKDRFDAYKTFCVSVFERNIFLYFECDEENANPNLFLKDIENILESWPGEEEKRYWMRMYDIFHYSKAINEDFWIRNSAKTPLVRIVKLKPELMSSYIFYHQQLQEEIPRLGDKYGIIALQDNLILFYMEMPEELDTTPYAGKLTTSNTPGNWVPFMESHFIPWQDATEFWRAVECVYYHAQ